MKRPFPGFHAFTIQYDGIADKLISEAAISEAFDPTSDPSTHPRPYQVKALWDTGATGSVITPGIVKALNLQPIGKMNLSHGGGESEHFTYLVQLFLPNKVGFSGVKVAALDNLSDSGFGIIVGMDIIMSGDFSLTNHQGKSCFTFRVPSVNRIDYVEQFNMQLRGAQGPNESCACGSGKKFKKCHGGRG